MISKLRTFRIRIALFLSSHRGKVLFNLFYGMGAAIAILGTLFKLLHLDGANIMLAVGLGTEVFIFALSSLEPPYRNYHWEYVFPILKSHDDKDRPDFQNLNANTGASPQAGNTVVSGGNLSAPVNAGNADETPQTGSVQATPAQTGTLGTQIIIQGNAPAGTVYAAGSPAYSGGGYSPAEQGSEPVMNQPAASGNNPVYRPHNNPVAHVTQEEARENYGLPNQVPVSEEDAQTLTDSIRKMGDAVTQLNNMADITLITENYISKLSGMAENLNRFSDATGSLAEVSNTLLESYRNITENSDSISANSKGYVEQMGNLNRNLMGLNTIYEIQLKSISSQIDTIDRVNNGLVHIREMYENSMGDSDRFNQETEAMAENIARLNRIYARMLEAMSPNAIFANMMAGAVKEESKTTPSNEENKES